MRIGVNTLFLVPGDVGGTEVYLRENLKEMIPGNPDDTFVLFTSSDNDDSLKKDLKHHDNVEFVQLPFRSAVRPLRILAEQTLLPWKVRRHITDVLWSPGYTAPLSCSCPQVLTIHDLQYKTHPDDLSVPERLTLDFLVRNGCRRCDSIIAVSEFSKQEIVRFGFAQEDKIGVVYEGVDPAFGEPADNDLFSTNGIKLEIPYILCVAHTYPHKQMHLLVEAFGKIMGEIPHQLVLVGKPRRGEPLVQASLKKLDDVQRISRNSTLQYDKLIALYQKADLFVLPSVYEGFGLPVLEALLAGTPVIVSWSASLPEVGGEHVVYFDRKSPDHLAEKIMEMLQMDSIDRLDRIEKGREWAKTFSWKKSAIETTAVLHAVKGLSKNGRCRDDSRTAGDQE